MSVSRFTDSENVPTCGDTRFDTFLSAVMDQQPVAGLTHNYYRYPGRFSHSFARAAILAFTKPGDVVLDPFMGGATALVEARAYGRHSLGSDISSLSRFLARVKTTPLADSELRNVERWVQSLAPFLNLRHPPARTEYWLNEGYQRHIPWPIRKSIELALARLSALPTTRQRRFARCILLKLGQWALDCRERIPKAREFREALSQYCEMFVRGMRDFRRTVEENRLGGRSNPVCVRVQAPAEELSSVAAFSRLPKRPTLVVTSPPYPGVYVLYHRWKVRGRKESAAPFWLADCRDGQGQAYYSFGDRRHEELKTYFQGIRSSFAAIRRIVDPEALIIQLLAFKQPDWQLPRYLTALEEAGYREVLPKTLSLPINGRLWRTVPGRRWFALIQGDLATAQELVLFHRPNINHRSEPEQLS